MAEAVSVDFQLIDRFEIESFCRSVRRSHVWRYGSFMDGEVIVVD